jgi:hypothetical protein
MMKRILIVLGVLLLTAVIAAADPLGITVGMDLSFGNVLADNYNFAGKADPPLEVPAGLGGIRPYFMFGMPVGPVMLGTTLSDKFSFDNPQTNDFKFSVYGTYNLPFSNDQPGFTFYLENLLRLRSYDWSLAPSDGALGWSDMVIPSARYAYKVSFGEFYGKVTLPVSFTDPDFAEYYATLGIIDNPGIYQKPFIFAIPEIGFNSSFGLGAYLTSNIQIFPDRSETSIAPGYDKYASDIPVQQITLGIGYIAPKFVGSVVFEFPVPGKDVYPDGIKNQGFAISPTAIFVIRSNMRFMTSVEFTNIGKDTGNADADKLSVSPLISLVVSF